MRHRPRCLVCATLVALLIGCTGGGAAALAPIPGGFPPDERNANAVQLRLTPTALAKLIASPAPLVGALLGSLDLGVDASCGDPSVCCPGGAAQASCGPIALDLAQRAGDDPRLAVMPVAGGSRLDVSLRARVTTVAPIPVSQNGYDCTLLIDTTPGASQEAQINFPLQLVQDATTGTTRVVPGAITVAGLTSDDFTIQGPFGCSIQSWSPTLVTSVISQAFAGQLAAGLSAQACKRCGPEGVTSCGPFATACSDEGVCMEGTECLQELGLEGRLTGLGLLAGALPRSTGSMDLYEVAGGYATTDGNGIALGVLGGMLPAGAAHEQCGPPADPPAPVAISQSSVFQGNTDPSTGAPFDLAIGVHASQFDQLAYAAYQGGQLCLTVDSTTVPDLTTDLLTPHLPSLQQLAPVAVPMRIGLRPQAPPTVTLGQDPLLAAHFTQLELDVFATVEEQPVRLFTVVADADVPISLEGGQGVITPMLGDLSSALSNVSVKNVQGLTETPQEIADAFQQILPVALGGFGQLSAVALPTVGGLDVAVSSVASVDGDQFLAVYGNLVLPQAEQGLLGATGRAAASPSSRGLVVPGLPTPPSQPARDPQSAGGSSSRGHAGAIALLCVGAGVLFGRRQVRRLARAAAVLLVAFQLQACSCGGDGAVDAGIDAGVDGGGAVDGGGDGGASSPCGDQGCQPGEATRGPLGRYNAIASDGQRTVVTTYDERLGDLVVIDVSPTGDRTYTAVDGVPDETPTHDPGTYRGGVSSPGPDVGAWSSVALAGGLARVAYQDRDSGSLDVAIESTDGWSHHVVDSPHSPQTEAGVEASIAIDGTGAPAVAYLVVGAGAPTELRLARANGALPDASNAWTVQTLASVPEGPQRMRPTLLTLSSGRLAVVYDNPIRGALLLLLQTAPGASSFEETVLDSGPQRGQWASAVTDGTTIHVAYQDAAREELYYLSWNGAAGTPEQVDDGVRAGERPHNVGASATLFLDHGLPAIAYQDGLTADLDLAVRDGGWTHTTVAGGAPLDGFHVAAARSGGWLTWRQLKAGRTPAGDLVIQQTP